jgi:hypothetical protein
MDGADKSVNFNVQNVQPQTRCAIDQRRMTNSSGDRRVEFPNVMSRHAQEGIMNTKTDDKHSTDAQMTRIATILAIGAAILMLAGGMAGEVIVRQRLVPLQPTATPVGTCPGPVSARGLPPQLQLEFSATCVERIGP